MGNLLPFFIELIVAGLLAVTVGYCILLDRRLVKLRANETAMRQTVVDLGLATERAERAIDALRNTLADCDRTLNDRLRSAEKKSSDLEGQIRTGDEVLDRIGKVVSAARRALSDVEGGTPVADEEPAADTPSTMIAATVAAAEAFAERARRRMLDQAA